MKTFENMSLEFKHLPAEKDKQINKLLSYTLMQRIFMRGISEQYYAKNGIMFWDDERMNAISNRKNLHKNTNFWYLYKYPSVVLS